MPRTPALSLLLRIMWNRDITTQRETRNDDTQVDMLGVRLKYKATISMKNQYVDVLELQNEAPIASSNAVISVKRRLSREKSTPYYPDSITHVHVI
jgi:hypothetical protein